MSDVPHPHDEGMMGLNHDAKQTWYMYHLAKNLEEMNDHLYYISNQP